MTSDIPKSSTRLRIIQFVAGGIAIVLSGYRLSNLTTASPSFLTHPGIALLVIGIGTMVKGILNSGNSKTTKAIEIGIGIIAIIGGLLTMMISITTSSRLTWSISLFILIYGAGLVVTGITRRGKANAVRISKIVIGVIVVTLTGLVLEYPGLSITMMSALSSTNLLLSGIEIIITGAIGHKIVRTP